MSEPSLMRAVFRGRRYTVVGWTDSRVWLEPVVSTDAPSNRLHVSPGDADLILDPSDEDMDLAAAFERGEINAFEYLDGHTYPPGREIVPPPREAHIARSSRREH